MAAVSCSLKAYCDRVQEENQWKLEKRIDFEHDGIQTHLGAIADAMDEWEGPVAEALGLNTAAIAGIKVKHQDNLNLQTREALHRWKEANGLEATYRNLIVVFLQAGKTSFAEAVCKVLGGKQGIQVEKSFFSQDPLAEFICCPSNPFHNRTMDPREEDDFEDVSNVMHPSFSAKIRGNITKLSPMMQGRRSKYFRGKISGRNGKPKQLFGFGDELHKQLHKCQESRKTVMLSNCGVQPIPNSEDMEIKVNELTNVRESSVAVEAVQTNVTKLDQLSTLKVYDPITVVVEALNVGDPEQTPDGNYVQNISICDETGSCRLAIWESHIGKIVKGESYHLTNATVREYNGEMFLSTSKCHPFKVEIIREVGGVGGDHAVTVCAENVTIIGVKNFENYDTCQECNGEVQCDDDNKEVVKCSECQMIQLGSQCKKLLKAELVVVSVKGQKMSLNANGEAIAAIADVSISGDVSKKDVLNAKPFTMSYSGKEIVFVDRK